jgi:hypothetical protein
MTQNLTDEPLGLSVHSMPVLSESSVNTATYSGRWKMLAIMLVCSLPVMAAYFAYYVVRPQGRAGYGELIMPVRPVSDQTGTTLDGAYRPLSALKGQWLLVTVGAGACAQDCQQRLYLQRQLREMLGKDKERVDGVWLVNDQGLVTDSLRQLLGSATVLRVDPSILASWLVAPPGRALSDFLFVVDPMGNTMMRFPAQFDGAGAARARRDLERLLRASASWDAPGR